MKTDDKIIRIKILLNELAEKERVKVFDDYCHICGNLETDGKYCMCQFYA